MILKWIQNLTKPSKIIKILSQIGQNQIKIKPNVFLDGFGGSWSAGSAKGCPHSLGGCTFFALLVENCCPMIDFGSHFGSKIGPKTIQKWIQKSMPEMMPKELKKHETWSTNRCHIGALSGKLIFRKTCFYICFKRVFEG